VIPIYFEPLQELFDPEGPVPKELLTGQVYEDFRKKYMIGVPDGKIEVTFQPNESSDILIKKIDPEKALGYSTFTSDSDYFDRLDQELALSGTGG